MSDIDMNIVDSIAEQFIELGKQSDEIDEKKNALRNLTDQLAGEPDKVRGSITLTGNTYKIRLVRKMNVSYNEARLAELLKEYPFLLPLFNVKFNESGSKVVDLLASPGLPPALVSAFAEIRTEKKGATGISVLA